ncbi:hypothetical protein Mgra_00000733, partial [Meloidogyne graminicola]
YFLANYQKQVKGAGSPTNQLKNKRNKKTVDRRKRKKRYNIIQRARHCQPGKRLFYFLKDLAFYWEEN